MHLFFKWGWLLGLALMAPIALPAGGSDYLNGELRINKSSNRMVSSTNLLLSSSPFVFAPVLREIPIGTPIRILRISRTNDGIQWFHVQLSTIELLDSPLSKRRGWIRA